MRRSHAKKSYNSEIRTSARSSFRILTLLAAVFGCAILPLGYAAPPVRAAEPKPTLRLKADSVVFNRANGDVRLEGDVHIVRTTAGRMLTVDCDEVSGKMKDGKMKELHMKGNVRLETGEFSATGAEADFDFSNNIITLHGTTDKPASMTSPEMTSTGPTIIFFLDEERVKMPDGGETVVNLESAAVEKKEKQ